MTREDFEAELGRRQDVARVAHERKRKNAIRQNRDFPLLPYECSWAYEEELRKQLNAPLPAGLISSGGRRPQTA